MRQFVELYLKRNRGWPWPEDSFGLTPMFGVDGWCHSCGMPLRPQTGSLILQRKGMKRCEGAWTPYWRYDAICLERSLSEDVAARFDVELRVVNWHGAAPGEAMQIVVSSSERAWFDPEQLRRRTYARHSATGATCSECGVWRWMPLDFDSLPPLVDGVDFGDAAVVASPEWFGDGWKSYRQILVRRELAELIADASPKDFRVAELP